MTLTNRRHTHSQTHTSTHTHSRAHEVWWKCYLSISQLNVLISLVAHGCLGKQQSQLQKAESIHLAGCQRRRQRAGLAPLPAPCGGVISLLHSDSRKMPIHTCSLRLQLLQYLIFDILHKLKFSSNRTFIILFLWYVNVVFLWQFSGLPKSWLRQKNWFEGFLQV